MNQEARIAFIISQAAMLNARIAMMQAANIERQENGHSISYGEEQFNIVISEFQCLEHNAVIEYLRQ